MKQRLINANALYYFCSEQRVKETGAYSKGLNNAFNIVRSALHNENATPTIEAAPVVHKTWIEKPHANVIVCSECKEPYFYSKCQCRFNFAVFRRLKNA